MPQPARRPWLLSKKVVFSSPWVRVIEKRVRFAEGRRAETFHSLAQADYVTVLAETPGGLVPIVRQFRPAVGSSTWELPSGLMEAGETPEETCRRELWEETGLKAKKVRYMGEFYADTGRLENKQHVFHAKTHAPAAGFKPEAGMELSFVSPARLKSLARTGRFGLSSHIAVLFLCGLT